MVKATGKAKTKTVKATPTTSRRSLRQELLHTIQACSRTATPMQQQIGDQQQPPPTNQTPQPVPQSVHNTPIGPQPPPPSVQNTPLPQPVNNTPQPNT